MNREKIIALMDEEVKECNQCIQAKKEKFMPESCMMRYEENRISKLGILMKGKAILFCIDQYGNRNILEYLEEGCVFGEFFFLSNETYTFEIRAITECEVMFMQYDFIVHRCQRACEHHANIISYLFQIMAMKSTQLQHHLDILSQRNIRAKLCKYFEYLVNQSETKDGKIVLQISFTELSDYLCVERTSMMREISKMEKDGIIMERKRNTFLYRNEYKS